MGLEIKSGMKLEEFLGDSHLPLRMISLQLAGLVAELVPKHECRKWIRFYHLLQPRPASFASIGYFLVSILAITLCKWQVIRLEYRLELV
jgi:hypothetical protein